MDTDRPLARVFIDVDGVINAVCDPRLPFPDCWSPDTWATSDANGFTITWSTGVAQALRTLFTTPRLEVIWLTTWTEDARTKIAPLLELADAPALPQPFREKNGWWKLEHVRRLRAEEPTVPFIWVDDDIAWDQEARDFLAGLPEDTFLAVSPKTEVGLTPFQLEKIQSALHGWGVQIANSMV